MDKHFHLLLRRRVRELQQDGCWLGKQYQHWIWWHDSRSPLSREWLHGGKVHDKSKNNEHSEWHTWHQDTTTYNFEPTRLLLEVGFHLIRGFECAVEEWNFSVVVECWCNIHSGHWGVFQPGISLVYVLNMSNIHCVFPVGLLLKNLL